MQSLITSSRGVIFDASPYYRSHGRAPRGQGGWGFIDVNQQYAADYIDKVVWAHGAFADARRQAAAQFPKGSVVAVLP